MSKIHHWLQDTSQTLALRWCQSQRLNVSGDLPIVCVRWFFKEDGISSEKAIRTRRDKSVVNSIKVLMFTRSVHYMAFYQLYMYTHFVYRLFSIYNIRIAVICQVSFQIGTAAARRSCSCIFPSSILSLNQRQNLKQIIILYTYTKLVPVHKCMCICSDISSGYVRVRIRTCTHIKGTETALDQLPSRVGGDRV